MRIDDYPLAPMVLGLILGPIAESNMRRALAISDGSYAIFYAEPLTIAILALAVLSLLSPFIREWVDDRRSGAGSS